MTPASDESETTRSAKPRSTAELGRLLRGHWPDRDGESLAYAALGLATKRPVMRGFQADVHCVTGAPREAMCRVLKAEDGGIGGKGLWRPVSLGLRPTNESAALKQYLAGGFVIKKA